MLQKKKGKVHSKDKKIAHQKTSPVCAFLTQTKASGEEKKIPWRPPRLYSFFCAFSRSHALSPTQFFKKYLDSLSLSFTFSLSLSFSLSPSPSLPLSLSLSFSLSVSRARNHHYYHHHHHYHHAGRATRRHRFLLETVQEGRSPMWAQSRRGPRPVQPSNVSTSSMTQSINQ